MWWDLAQRRTDVRNSMMYKIVHKLILIEAIKYVMLQCWTIIKLLLVTFVTSHGSLTDSVLEVFCFFISVW